MLLQRTDQHHGRSLHRGSLAAQIVAECERRSGEWIPWPAVEARLNGGSVDSRRRALFRLLDTGLVQVEYRSEPWQDARGQVQERLRYITIGDIDAYLDRLDVWESGYKITTSGGT